MEVAVSVWYILRCTRTLSARIAAGRAGCLQWCSQTTMSSGSSGLGWFAQTASPKLCANLGKERSSQTPWSEPIELNMLPHWNRSEDVPTEREGPLLRISNADTIFGQSSLVSAFQRLPMGDPWAREGGRKVKKKLQRNQCWTLGNVICSWCWRSTYKMMQVRRNKLLPSLFPEKLFSNCSRGTLSSCAVRNNMHMLILMQEGTALLLLF